MVRHDSDIVQQEPCRDLLYAQFSTQLYVGYLRGARGEQIYGHGPFLAAYFGVLRYGAYFDAKVSLALATKVRHLEVFGNTCNHT